MKTLELELIKIKNKEIAEIKRKRLIFEKNSLK
jgi:hypothetical protein